MVAPNLAVLAHHFQTLLHQRVRPASAIAVMRREGYPVSLDDVDALGWSKPAPLPDEPTPVAALSGQGRARLLGLIDLRLDDEAVARAAQMSSYGVVAGRAIDADLVRRLRAEARPGLVESAPAPKWPLDAVAAGVARRLAAAGESAGAIVAVLRAQHGASALQVSDLAALPSCEAEPARFGAEDVPGGLETCIRRHAEAFEDAELAALCTRLSTAGRQWPVDAELVRTVCAAELTEADEVEAELQVPYGLDARERRVRALIDELLDHGYDVTGLRVEFNLREVPAPDGDDRWTDAHLEALSRAGGG